MFKIIIKIYIYIFKLKAEINFDNIEIMNNITLKKIIKLIQKI